MLYASEALGPVYGNVGPNGAYRIVEIVSINNHRPYFSLSLCADKLLSRIFDVSVACMKSPVCMLHINV